MDKENLIFISYASEDKDRVTPFYNNLKSSGLNVWIDHKEIIGGQNWDFEIQRAFNKASIILLFISKHSCFKRGYIQREIKVALKNLEEKLPDDIYIVPIQLDVEVDRPEQLKKIQFISANSPTCIEQIKRAINFQLQRLGAYIEEHNNINDFIVTKLRLKEEWDGCPGYQFESDKIALKSKIYGNIEEIPEFINGKILSSLFSARGAKFEQDFQWWNYGQDTSLRTNTTDISLKEFYANESFISLRFLWLKYNAGAAHHNYWTTCYNFTLRPITVVQNIQSIFLDPNNAFTILQRIAREQLANSLNEDTNDNMITRGTKCWDDFHTFFFAENGIQLDFPPYQAGAFTDGIQRVIIDYETIVHLVKPTFASMFTHRLFI